MKAIVHVIQKGEWMGRRNRMITSKFDTGCYVWTDFEKPFKKAKNATRRVKRLKNNNHFNMYRIIKRGVKI